MSGDAHAPYLVASLVSLRRHYDGEVVVHAYPESMDTVNRIAEDSRLDVQPRWWEPFYRGKNGQFINKIRLMQTLDSSIAMYLDADTLVSRSLDLTFEFAKEFSFTGTQFCDWVSNTGTIKNRVTRLLDVPEIDPVTVNKVLSRPYYSVNGGVFFCDPKSEILPLWEKWSLAAKHIFICDETVLHAIMARYWETEFRVLSGGAFNCSPKYRQANLSPEDVVIWHGHGDAFVRPKKCKAGVDLWWPAFMECLNHNYGGIQEWLPKTNNRFLTDLLKENGIEI
jgi:hypothetical protein